MLFFLTDTATPEIYTLSLHDALPIYGFNPARPDDSLPVDGPQAPRDHQQADSRGMRNFVMACEECGNKTGGNSAHDRRGHGEQEIVSAACIAGRGSESVQDRYHH